MRLFPFLERIFTTDISFSLFQENEKSTISIIMIIQSFNEFMISPKVVEEQETESSAV